MDIDATLPVTTSQVTTCEATTPQDAKAADDATTQNTSAAAPSTSQDASAAAQTSYQDAATADALVLAFDTGTLDPAAFHHADHVRLTWALLQRMPVAAAIDHLRAGLQRIAAAVGKPDHYHETITVFFTTQIHDRMTPGEPWAGFASRNADILASPRAFLARHYRAETIQSDRARQGFVPPDRTEQ